MPLNPKQRRFLEEYLVDLNASAAARRAGYSEKTAGQIGERLLKNVEVQKAIQAGQAARQQRTEVTQDMVLRELAKIAFADQRQVMKWGPGGVKLRDSSELTADEAAAVAEVSETIGATGGGSLKLKTHDKVGALKLLGEHLGMFRQKLEVTGKDGGPVETKSNRDLSDEELAAELARYGIKPPAS